MGRMTDWPTSELGDIEQLSRKCAVCGRLVQKKTGLFWFSGDTVSFYHNKCAVELISGLMVDIAMKNMTGVSAW